MESTKVYINYYNLNFNYGFLKYFPEYEQIMDECTKNPEDNFIGVCNSSEYDGLTLYAPNIHAECPTIMSYLYKINYNKDYAFSELGCKYLYYWLYRYLLLEKYKNSVFTIYHMLLSLNISVFQGKETKNILRPLFKDEDLKKLTAVYELNKTLHFVNINCEPENDNEFCSEVEGIMGKYNLQKKTPVHESFQGIVSSTCRTNIAVPISITIIVMLLACLFLFVVLKFTSFGSWIRREIQRKRYIWDNTYEEKNIFDESEMFNTSLKNIEHNILYNSY
ncbi:variable surface protein [Plasmodium gonderi]|uniref:Variable surface protein n=1 Tax=Plasmodium gonderi TaxID=77519 RepID=A0A1Y1JT02_PLAGO|nr:variable surface protein [Plasmodium gonderi]GAW84267.1 variable surface protein [Plasmodium gonderi]